MEKLVLVLLKFVMELKYHVMEVLGKVKSHGLLLMLQEQYSQVVHHILVT